jgi:hypothetical protein
MHVSSKGRIFDGPILTQIASNGSNAFLILHGCSLVFDRADLKLYDYNNGAGK